MLYRITRNKDEIIANNLDAAIQAESVDGVLYGYPVAATTFVMFYDKSMYTEEEVKNLNTMMEKELPKGVTNFSMDIDNGWYNSCFFQAAGCRLFGEDGLDPTQCDFNNEKGLMAGNYLAEYLTNSESGLKARFELRPGSSTNKLMEEAVAAASNNEAMQAQTEQADVAIIQTSIPQVANFWTPAEAFGAGLMNQSITRENMQKSLDLMVENILSKLG